MIETLKVKPSHESQGEYVLINKSDFDEVKHKLLPDKSKEPVKTKPSKVKR
jgi:hypothetical protein